VGCSDQYIWLINGASQGSYTLGNTVGTLATAGQTITIQGRRGGCSGTGCDGSYATLATWTVIARPTSVVSGTANVCSGATTSTISVALTGAQPWALTWFDGTTSTNVTGIAASPYTFNVSPSGTTTYTTTALSDANCTSQAGDRTGSATVTVNANPTLTSVVPDPAATCEGYDVTVTLNGMLPSVNPSTVTYSIGLTTGLTATVSNVNGSGVGSFIINPTAAQSVATIEVTNISRTVVTPNCPTAFSISGTLPTVTPSPVITSQPSALTLCENGSGSFTAAASGSPTYQWYYSNTGLPGSWIITDAVGGLSGHTSGTLSLSSIPVSYNGFFVRCEATENGCTTPTNSVLLSVRATPTASISGTTTVCQGVASPNITFTNGVALPVTVTYNVNGGSNTTVAIGAGIGATAIVPQVTSAFGPFVYNLVSVAYTDNIPSGGCSNGLSGSATVTVIDNSAPTNDEATVSSLCWEPNGSNTYTITIKSSAASGLGGSTYGMMALINYQGTNASDNGPTNGGYFAWNTTAALLNPPFAKDLMSCTGGGFVAMFGGGYGNTACDLISAVTSVSGNQRTVTFTVRPTVTFPSLVLNDVSVYSMNSCGVATGWDNFDINFNSVVPAQPSAIVGTLDPEIGTSQVYSVTNVPGITYTWAFPASWNITAGQGTNSVTVTVGTINGTISVTPSNICGAVATARTATTTIPNYRAKFESANFGASTWCSSTSRTVTVTIKNNGVSTWTDSGPDVNVGVRWSGWADHFVRTDAGNLAPGATQTYSLVIEAKNATAGPTYGANLAAGANNLFFDVVAEGCFWFRNNATGGSCTGVTVGGNAEYNPGAITIVAAAVVSPISGASDICVGSSTTFSNTPDASYYSINTYTSSGTFTAPRNLLAATTSVLVVAGGGGGGGADNGGSNRASGGGGGGGVISNTSLAVTAGSYPVVVGGGGAAGTGGSSAGGDGGNSSFNGLTAIGGGGGGTASFNSSNGRNGGSGGGGGQGSNVSSTGTSGQGFNGINGTGTAGAGGSGAGAAGTVSTGGVGVANSISGASVFYGGGGGGSTQTNASVGGGNGGGGASAALAAATPGTPNTGGGGGAGKRRSGTQYAGGAGGSGIVIIKWIDGEWTSDNTAVAMVDPATGVVTGISAGTTNINYTVRLNNACPITVSRAITVNPIPTAAISPATATVCSGSPQTLTASGGGTYVWSNGGSTTAATSFSPTSSTTYTVTVTNNGCTATESRTIRVPSNVSVPALTGDQTICESGGTTQFTVPFTNPTGGTITTVGSDYRVHTFTANDNFVTAQPLSAEIMVVGGGGSGGPAIGGGGGGGAVVYVPRGTVAANTFPVVLGAGGVSTTANGASGGSSTAFGMTAFGGGTSGPHDAANGTTGGSGGGAASNNSVLNTGGAAVPLSSSLGSYTGTIFGSRGGNMLVARLGFGPTRAAGGGGAGAPALNVNSNYVGAGLSNGGNGIQIDIDGTARFWAGGGGGGVITNGTAGSGGLGGGGGGAGWVGDVSGLGGVGGLNLGGSGNVGDNLVDPAGGNGGANTGGGGGGGGWDAGLGGAGGSGIVIVRYPIITNGVWESSNTAVATVNSSGLVSGVGPGNATISYHVVLQGCTTTVTRDVTVLTRPTSSISGNASVCVGFPRDIRVVLTGTAPWNITFSDGFVANGVTTSPYFRTVNDPLTTTYTVTALSDAICTSIPAGRRGSARITRNACPNTWLGITNDWNSTSNWSNGMLPGCGVANSTNVIIPTTPFGGLYPLVSGVDANADSITINRGATVTVDASRSLNVCGSWIAPASGTFSSALGDGVVNLNGTGTQTITGRTKFNTLKSSKTSGTATVSATAVVEINTALELQGNGNFDAGTDRITFKSFSDMHCAVLDNFSNSFTGIFLGTIKAERSYGAVSSVVSSVTGARHQMSSPLNNVPVSQFSASGTEGYARNSKCDETLADGGSPYGNFHAYDEAAPGAADCGLQVWFNKTTGVAENGRGYSVRRSSPGKITLTGSPNLNNSYTRVLGNSVWNNSTKQGNTIVSGYHIVGNPYLSNIELNAPFAGFSSNVYIWVTNGPQAGTYEVYDLNSGGTIIPPFGTFTIRNIGGSDPLTLSNANRTRSGTPPYYLNNSPEQLYVSVTNKETGLLDKTLVAFREGGSEQYDEAEDAMKLFGDPERHSLFTKAEKFQATRNILPKEDKPATVPMGFYPGVSGDYTMTFDGANSFPEENVILVEDKFLGKWHNVRNGNYTFKSDAEDNLDRFVLHFNYKKLSSVKETQTVLPERMKFDMYPNPTTGILFLETNAKDEVKIEITDINGRVVFVSEMTEQTNIDITNLASSVYQVKLSGAGGTVVKKLVKE
jgi:hypothetical protein